MSAALEAEEKGQRGSSGGTALPMSPSKEKVNKPSVDGITSATSQLRKDKWGDNSPGGSFRSQVSPGTDQFTEGIKVCNRKL